MASTKNILITGPPRCGKSTLIESIARKITGSVTGFITKEIIEKGRRIGFKINTFDGQEGILAHEAIKSPIRVGKYGVNIQDLEVIAVTTMVPSNSSQIIIIDEIGKMECYSNRFRDALLNAMDSSNKLIGSIALKGTPFIEEIKRRTDINLIRVTEKNRESLPDLILEMLASL